MFKIELQLTRRSAVAGDYRFSYLCALCGPFGPRIQAGYRDGVVAAIAEHMATKHSVKSDQLVFLPKAGEEESYFENKEKIEKRPAQDDSGSSNESDSQHS